MLENNQYGRCSEDLGSEGLGSEGLGSDGLRRDLSEDDKLHLWYSKLWFYVQQLYSEKLKELSNKNWESGTV